MPAAIGGEITRYTSPNGVEEQCIILARIPGGVYSRADEAEEAAFCGIDFYSGDHALCPKIFSTSPGTLIYDISLGPFAGRPADFEDRQCHTSSPIKRGAVGEPVLYKTTMNDPRTSATFSTASLLYYHFARYLDADIHVPVSVYRSMDRGTHLQRVSGPGTVLSAHRKGGAMNHAAWQLMVAAERNPEVYRPTDELFTADRAQIYGVLLHPQGERYGAAVNGTRESGWGKGQALDFQQTAPFLALRSDRPLFEAMEDGIHQAAGNPRMRQAMQQGVSPEQMVYWMKELTEITLLDYIFSQQDRIGNIDYLSYWYWVEDGRLQRRLAGGTRVPEDIAVRHPIRLRRTHLNDNDAGGRIPYANFAKQTGMLEGIRHYNADLYARLVSLDRDLQAQGAIHRYLTENFRLSGQQIDQVVENTRLAANILRSTCRAGALRFDLDPEAFLLTGVAESQTVDCENP